VVGDGVPATAMVGGAGRRDTTAERESGRERPADIGSGLLQHDEANYPDGVQDKHDEGIDAHP
jgi:hypothetical protein